MPRPVVPIRMPELEVSRERSSSRWTGRIRAAVSASIRFCGLMETPCAFKCSISSTSAQGSTTTPLPMMASLPGRTTPDGSSDNL